MPELSIVIPAYNSEKHIGPLLDSIFGQSFKDFEVHLIDDASSDSTGEIAKKYKIEYLRLEDNKGPANARNIGAEKARGDILVFFDSDVVLMDGVLGKFHDWIRHGGADAVNGIYDKYPVNSGLVPLYKAFQEQIWFHEDVPGDSTVIFNTSVGAIKKDIFWKAGGFSAAYRGAEVEDYDFSFRLSKLTRVVLDRSIRVGHNFPYFAKLVRTFFRRSYLWMRLFMAHRKFSSSGTTVRQAMVMICFSASLCSFFLALILKPYWLLAASLLLFVSSLWLDMKFLRFNMNNKGVLFMMFGIGMNYFLSLVVISGVLAGFLSVIPDRAKI